MDFTFLMSCESVSDRSRTGVYVGSSKIDFQLAGYTFYLANTSLGYLIFLIHDHLSWDQWSLRNDGHLYNQTIHCPHLPAAYADLISNLNSGLIWPKLLPPFLLLVSTRSPSLSSCLCVVWPWSGVFVLIKWWLTLSVNIHQGSEPGLARGEKWWRW